VELQEIEGSFCVCKVENTEQIDFSQAFLFIAKTPDEISVVCKSGDVPSNAIAIEDGWKALRISGILDFGLIGILAKISNLLADARISIFAISTYNTDYILLKAENFDNGLQVLINNGYIVR